MDGQVRCPRCWKRGPRSAKFCRRCGCALTGLGATPQAPAMPVVARVMPRPVRGPTTLLALVVSVAFILVGVLIFNSLTQSEVSPSSFPSPTVNQPATVDPPPDVVTVPQSVPPPYPSYPDGRYRGPYDGHWEHPWEHHEDRRDEPGRR